jgi:hypothetical protein
LTTPQLATYSTGMNHPLRQYLEGREETLSAFAARVQVHRANLWRAMKGDRGLSLGPALRIERATGGLIPASLWIRKRATPKPATRSRRALAS